MTLIEEAGSMFRIARLPMRVIEGLERHPEFDKGTWDCVKRVRAQRSDFEESYWPKWLYVHPSELAAPLFGIPGVYKGEAWRRDHWDDIIDAIKTGALSAWRDFKPIFDFDPTVFDAIWTSAYKGPIPTNLLLRPPEPCAYVVLPPTVDQSIFSDVLDEPSEVKGFFYYPTLGPVDLEPVILFIVDSLSRNYAFSISLDYPTIQDAIADLYQGFVWRCERKQIPISPTALPSLTTMIIGFVNIMLYNCAMNAQMITTPAPPTTQLSKRKSQQKGYQSGPPPLIKQVGYKIGVSLRRGARDAQSRAFDPNADPGTGSPKAPHYRSAHFRVLKNGRVVWVRPAWVNTDNPNDLVPNIRRMD